jgi:hypothetical protein
MALMEVTELIHEETKIISEEVRIRKKKKTRMYECSNVGRFESLFGVSNSSFGTSESSFGTAGSVTVWYM